MGLIASPCKKCEFVKKDRGCKECQDCIKEGTISKLRQHMKISLVEKKWSDLQSGIVRGRVAPRTAIYSGG
jgi:hypothetical protein